MPSLTLNDAAPPACALEARERQIPIVINIDVEPDGVFIDRRQQLPWTGYEASTAVIPQLRDRVFAATGRPIRFTWLFRLDSQIAETYGNPAWPLLQYGALVEDAQRQGDDLGAHVHPFRWRDEHNAWVADYGDQRWVESCVHLGCAAYRQVFGADCRSFSMGNHWLNEPTLRVLEDLGVQYDMSVLSASSESGFTPELGRFTGECPDFASVPRHPYRASAHDFRVPDPERATGTWILPLSTQVHGSTRHSLRSFVASARDRILRRSSHKSKLLLRQGPSNFRNSFDYLIAHAEQPYFLFSIRSALFALPDLVARWNESFDFLLSHPEAKRFVFTTPAEAVDILSVARGALPGEQ
jgi:hypothetical protein